MKVLLLALVVLAVVMVVAVVTASSGSDSSAGLTGNAARYHDAVQAHLEASFDDAKEFQSDIESAFENPSSEVAVATVFAAGEMYKVSLEETSSGQMPALIVSLSGSARAEGDAEFDARVDAVNAALGAYAAAATTAANTARTVVVLDEPTIAELTAALEGLAEARLAAVSAFVDLVPEES